MTFKNKILQQHAEKIGQDYQDLLKSGEKGYNAIFILCEKYSLSRFDIYRNIKHAGYKILVEPRPKNGPKFTSINDRKLPIDK